MEHLAIMKNPEIDSKILNGRKKIESRWYSVKYRPWDKIKKEKLFILKIQGNR